MYHAFRLMYEVESMLDGKTPRIFFEDESEERLFLMDVRNEKISFKKCYSLVYDKLELLNKNKPFTSDILIDKLSLDSKGFEILNQWVIDLRRNSLLSLK
jgi:hypothetical protein